MDSLHLTTKNDRKRVMKKSIAIGLINTCLIIVGIVFPAYAQAVRSHEKGPLQEANRGLPAVVIVTTGGTIAEKIDPKTGAAVPAVSGTDLIKAVPQLSDVANIKVVNFSNIDSSQMTPQIWIRLSKTVDDLLKDSEIVGAVVTHGTDTMAEGAFFLELTLATDKPVVFVGAMRNASELSPDGPANLMDAVVQVCSAEARDWGVTVTMNQYINAARDVTKTETTNMQAFDSGEKGCLGYLVDGRVIRFNARRHRQKFPLPNRLPEVVLLTTYAGDEGRLVRYAADSGAEGIVIEGVGAGNVNASTYEAIKYAIEKGVAVVVTSRVEKGGVYPLYGDAGGGATLSEAGAILAGDLKGPKARILLMLALPLVKKDHSKLQKFFDL